MSSRESCRACGVGRGDARAAESAVGRVEEREKAEERTGERGPLYIKE